ncbi:chloramphenicol acetyltransferase [Curvivirga sp.]|uniref:chloramphenicol acetyltransferase n=1 Tax=Curvivirga sp. TaxID=2856848 RepID=UPI003B5A5644
MNKSKQTKQLSEEPTIHETAIVLDSQIGKWTEIGPRSKIIESSIGDYSYAIHECDLIYSNVGKFVNIAAHVRLNPGQHPMDRASMHHFQYRSSAYNLGDDDMSFFDWRREKTVTVGHDAWIGHGAIIQGGVTIGIGSVIGSGSIVTKDVSPYTIVAGVPAKLIRPRFDKDIQDALLRIRWWDWDHQDYLERMEDFRKLSASEFCLKYDPA